MKSKTPLIIVADMGATFSRLAFIDEYQAIRHVKTYPSANFESPKEVVLAYLADINESELDHLFIAVAAPIIGDRLILTNNHWDFSQQAVAQALNTKVTFVNDFEALSLSLDHLSQAETIEIGQHQENRVITPPFQAKVVIGTGTGFGTAMSLETPEGPISIPSEGGHALYSPQDKEETEIVRLAIEKLGRPVIVEDLLACKHGIHRLIEIIAEIDQVDVHFEKSPEGLLMAALETADPFAIRILDRYCMMLGNVASNIMLATGATGGIYIGGGFSPRFSEFLQASQFRECFLNKSAVREILESTPTYLITHPYATLVGLLQILPRYL